jgi:peptide deformylase
MSKIITVPNPMLREISKPIKSLDKKTLQLISDLESTLSQGESPKSPKGIGLSGVQIAKPLRVFCTYLPPSGDPNDEKQKPIIKTFINPEIVKSSKKKTLGEKEIKGQKLNVNDKHNRPILEGCLSIPGIWGPVWRHQWVKLRYFTLKVNPEHSRKANTYTLSEHSERFSSFPARVIQHELDHLNGILFTDYSLKDNLPLYESRGEKLEEISL